MAKRYKVTLSGEEKKLLETSSKGLLLLLDEVSQHKYFEELRNMYSDMLSLEMKVFFIENEKVISDSALAKKHAEARGKVEMLRTIIRLMQGSRIELDRRAKIIKDKKGE